MFLPAATKLGQGNVFTGVCDSVNREGGLPQCMLGYHPPWEQTPPPGADTHTPPGPDSPPWEQTHPLRDQTPLGADTPLEQTLPVNKRPVRILLECILVTPVSQSCYSQGGGGVMMLLPVMDSTHPLDSTSKQYSCPHPILNSPPPRLLSF